MWEGASSGERLVPAAGSGLTGSGTSGARFPSVRDFEGGQSWGRSSTLFKAAPCAPQPLPSSLFGSASPSAVCSLAVVCSSAAACPLAAACIPAAVIFSREAFGSGAVLGGRKAFGGGAVFCSGEAFGGGAVLGGGEVFGSISRTRVVLGGLLVSVDTVSGAAGGTLD